MCTGTFKGQKETLDPLELEFQVAMIHPVEVLGTECGSLQEQQSSQPLGSLFSPVI